ncbi:hypothetical protein [Candidatus Nitrosocosmicus hydrocola]|uniref:hypothetical protein n=1 Tax=Candidatus Nitrosocosmicus hydrocola TaxID=1826872 RepID=UPI0011E5D975|nr:hypothetical protein [Candidatus Nitrosocosmicus hydrocola]
MKFIYNELYNGILNVLVNEEDHIWYNELFRRLNENREENYSRRDFNNVLREMVEKGELTKEDTPKKGIKVFYSLTTDSRKKHQLKILGEGREFERRREIYHLLLYYDLFKRSNLLTKNQLIRFLKKIGINFADISTTEEEEDKYVQMYNAALRNYDNESELLGFPKGIAIGKHLVNNEETKGKKYPQFYVVIPGFTTEEFISYLDKLRKNNQPKPFLNNIPLIPYVYYTRYTEDEIEESIKLLKETGFLRLTSPIYKGEMRYKISDERMIGFFLRLNIIHEYHFNLIITKISHVEIPNEEDKDWLACFFGKHKLDLIINQAHELRKNFLNDNQTVTKIQDIKKMIEAMETKLKILIVRLKETFDEILYTNPLLNVFIV